MLQNQQNAINAGNSMMGNAFGPGFMTPLLVPIPVGQLTMQAQQSAAASREQLLEDVAALDRYNRDVNDVNDRATESACGGPTRDAWAEAQGLGQVVVRAARERDLILPRPAREG